MELIFFNAYCKFRKKLSGYHIKRHPLLSATALAGLGLLAVVAYYISLSQQWKALAIISIIVEILSCLFLFIYSESFYLKSPFEDLSKFDNYCKDTYDNLCKIGMNKSRKSILQIKRNIQKHIALEERNKIKQDNDRRFAIEILYAPLFLTTYTFLNETTKDINELVAVAIVLAASIFVLSMFIQMCLDVLFFYRTYKLEQLKQFDSVLQGILDTQFNKTKLISKETPTTKG